jgi:hypothetical protein
VVSKFETTSLNILQVINLTLGLAVITLIGQNASKAVVVNHLFGSESWKFWAGVLIVLYIAIWLLKVLVDDHDHAGTIAGTGTGGLIFLFFCTLCYGSLSMAVAELQDQTKALQYLVGHFIVVTVWVLLDVGRRLVGEDTAIDGGAQRRVGWAFFNAGHIVVLLTILTLGWDGWLLVAALAGLVLLVLADALHSKTFKVGG